MRCVLVEVSDEMYHRFKEVIGNFPKDQVRIREESGDDDIYSADDDMAYQKALKELDNGETVSLEMICDEIKYTSGNIFRRVFGRRSESKMKSHKIPNQLAMKELKEILTSNFPDDIEKVILFGSRIKENAREYSDYDVLVILRRDYDWKFEDSICEAAFEIDLKHDIFIDVKVISNNELRTIKGKQPFISDAIEKGIVL